jgi:hypothetical protein
LPSSAHVHHADGSKRPDAPLVICQDAAYHLLLHVRTRVLKAGGNPNTERLCCHCKQLFPMPVDIRRNQCPACISARGRRFRQTHHDHVLAQDAIARARKRAKKLAKEALVPLCLP